MIFQRILESFQFKSWVDLGESLAPSFKYHITFATAVISGGSSVISILFGIDGLAFAALLLAFLFELVTGVKASQIQGQVFESSKLSRFSFKIFYYLIIISLSWLMSVSFEYRGRDLAAMFLTWLHIFLVIQIVIENIVSVSENIAVIHGKPKSTWILKIQEKFNQLLK